MLTREANKVGQCFMKRARYYQFVMFTVCLFVAPIALLSAEDMVPLKIDYPPVVPHNGPEISIASTDVDYYREAGINDGGSRPPVTLLVPIDTTNVALHKPVTSSTGTTKLYANLPYIREHPTDITKNAPTNLDWITCGDKTSPARRDDAFLMVGSRKQWIQIDLGAEVNIYAVAVWHNYFRRYTVYNNVAVQICDKPEFQENVSTIFNNDTKNELGLGAGNDRLYCETRWGKLIDAHGIKGRYVRLYSNGCNLGKMNDYIQVEVYGK